MKSFIKWLFGIFLFQTMGATGQEVDPKVKVLLPPAEPQASAKNGNNVTTSAKIESSKGSPTLPPGLNTTQMVAEQYRNSGALKPYTPANIGQTQSGTSKAMVNTAGKVLAGPPGSASGSAPLKGPEMFQEGSKKQKSTNQYESATSPLGGTTTSSMAAPVSGANRVPNSSNAAGNTYDKVPYLNPYEKAPSSPANPYGSLQLKPQSQNSNGSYSTLQLKQGSSSAVQGTNNTYGPPPVTGGSNTAKPSGIYGPAPNLKTQGMSNAYGPPPNAGGQNNTYGAPPRTGNQSSNTYGPPPNAGGGNTYGAPPRTGNQISNTYGPPPNAGGQNNTYGAPPRTGNQSSNTYGPPPNASGQNNTYGAPPRTGNQSSNTYGPPPNAGGQNNTYGAPPRTGGANAGKPSSTYGPAPALNAQGTNKTYGPPSNSGGANAGKPSSTYGPAPALNAQGTNNTYGPPPVTGGANAGKPSSTYGPAPALNAQGTNNTYGPPPVTGGANAGKPSSTYGPAPALNAQGANNTYGPPPYTGGANAGKPNGTYGPAPATGQSGQALPSTNSGYSKPPPPASGGQSAGSVPPSTSPAGGNPKVSGKPQNGGAIKKLPKSGPPVKR